MKRSFINYIHLNLLGPSNGLKWTRKIAYARKMNKRIHTFSLKIWWEKTT
jgi:hypothetical protein